MEVTASTTRAMLFPTPPDEGPAFVGAGSRDGAPHFGHAGAAELTSEAHSQHFTSGIGRSPR